MKQSKEPQLTLNVRSATKTEYKGLAHTITSINETGVFDILPTHANFISIIKNYIVIDKGLPSQKEIKLETGVLTVSRNKEDVYLGF